MTDCDHNFQHQGEVCWPSEYPMPGSGAHYRHYATAYFCTKCLCLRLTNERQHGNTYGKVDFGAVEYSRKPKDAQ